EFAEAFKKKKGVEDLAKRLFGVETQGQSMATRAANIMLGLTLPSASRAVDIANKREQNHRNLHIAFALAAYKHDHGKYPKRSADLAPKYLPEVPLDLFSGKAIIYQPGDKGYLLYSVGPNGKDDSGQTSEDDPRGDDLVIRMPLQELKVKK